MWTTLMGRKVGLELSIRIQFSVWGAMSDAVCVVCV